MTKKGVVVMDAKSLEHVVVEFFEFVDFNNRCDEMRFK